MKLFFRVLALITLGLVLVELMMSLVVPQSKANEQQVTLSGALSDSMCGAKLT